MNELMLENELLPLFLTISPIINACSFSLDSFSFRILDLLFFSPAVTTAALVFYVILILHDVFIAHERV